MWRKRPSGRARTDGRAASPPHGVLLLASAALADDLTPDGSERLVRAYDAARCNTGRRRETRSLSRRAPHLAVSFIRLLVFAILPDGDHRLYSAYVADLRVFHDRQQSTFQLLPLQNSAFADFCSNTQYSSAATQASHKKHFQSVSDGVYFRTGDAFR